VNAKALVGVPRPPLAKCGGSQPCCVERWKRGVRCEGMRFMKRERPYPASKPI